MIQSAKLPPSLHPPMTRLMSEMANKPLARSLPLSLSGPLSLAHGHPLLWAYEGGRCSEICVGMFRTGGGPSFEHRAQDVRPLAATAEADWGEDVAVGTVDTLDVSIMQDAAAIWRSESATIH